MQHSNRLACDRGSAFSSVTARFVAIEANNYALAEGTPSFDRFFEETDAI